MLNEQRCRTLLDLALTTLIACAFLVSPAIAQNKQVLNGSWRGEYSCGPARGAIYLQVSDVGDRLIFVDETLGNAEYKLGSGYVPKDRIYIADLRPVTPFEKLRLIEFEGRVSADGRTMKGKMNGCKITDLVSGSDPAPMVAAKPKPTNKTSPEPTKQTVAKREAQGFVGSWEGGSTACLNGPFDLRVDFGKLDANGNDAVVTVRDVGEADSYELPAKTGVGRVGLAVEAAPAPRGRFSKGPVSFELELLGGRMSGHSRQMSCSGLQLSKVKPKTATPSPVDDLSTKYRALIGTWDGAAYDDRDGSARRISLTISATASDVRKRKLDADVTLDGETWPAAIMESADEMVPLLPVRAGGGTGIMKGRLSTKLHKQGGHLLMSAYTSGGGYGYTYLWKRPESQVKSLQEICAEIDHWVELQDQARDVARDLKVEFYPTLFAFDPDAASFSQTAYDVSRVHSGAKDGPFDAQLVQCLLTAKNITPAQARFAGAFVDVDRVRKQRFALSQSSSPDKAVLEPYPTGVSLEKAIADSDRAEKALGRILSDVDSEKTPDRVLGLLERHAKEIQLVRPQVLAERLKKFGEKIEQAQLDRAKAVLAERQANARSIVQGVRIPREKFPPAQQGLLETVINGNFSTPQRHEIGFLAGMFSESVERCGKPTMSTRLALTELFKQGVVLTLGSDYMGSLDSMFSSVADGQAAFVDGVGFAKSLGCDVEFVDRFFQALAASWAIRSQEADGRAPLFVRSCALDRQPSQCECIMSVIENVQPRIARAYYSRGAIYSAMEKNPLIGIELGTRCGIQNY